MLRKLIYYLPFFSLWQALNLTGQLRIISLLVTYFAVSASANANLNNVGEADTATFEATSIGLDIRPSNTTCKVPLRPPNVSSIMLNELIWAPEQYVGLAQIPTDPAHWYAVVRQGKVVRYGDGVDQFTRLGIFVDLTDRVTTLWNGSNGSELGLLDIAFHPDFESNGYAYVYYTALGPSDVVPIIARLSRFVSRDNGATLDPTSEQIILSVDHTRPSHMGGHIAFDEQGYLYIGLGDGDIKQSAQNPFDLKGKMLRLNVDSQFPYGIPPDNPFVDGGGRPEVYALGFRNPWRWSFDQESGDIWLGDVGWRLYEEVDLVVKGGNYGFPIREGAHCINALAGTEISECDTTGLIDPVIDYAHADGGTAIIGGHVYRGTAIPNLQGIYIYADWAGKIYALTYDFAGNAVPQLILDSSFSILSLAEGLDNEIYVQVSGRILRIEPAGNPVPNTFPQTLSETGCFDPLDPTKPVAGLIPYDINAPLWSDGAAKQRWMALPDLEKITIKTDGDWEFPIGTVLVKNFLLGEKLLETRLFMRHVDGEWAGYSYEWDDAQTDAVLLPAAKKKVVNGQVWSFPSRNQCLQCHTTAAGGSLGPETAQMNRLLTYPGTGREANQIETLDHIGMFDAPLSAAVQNLPALAQPFDQNQPLDLRARGYLHANCSNCHRPGGPGQGPEDFRYYVAGIDMGVLNEPPTQGNFGIDDAVLLFPGHPEKSIISYRLHNLDLGRMPPLGTSVVDQQGSNLVDRWIRSGLGFGIPDSDGDELADNLDNCILDANGPLRPDMGGNIQLDTDGDGYGNLCDPDFNNNEIVDVIDFSILKSVFGSNVAVDQDLNGNGVVDAFDLSKLKSLFGRPPGPSAFAP